MRHFVRQSVKGSRCVALNQFYKSTTSDELFIIMSQEVKVNGNICEILDKYFDYKNRLRKILENENDSQFIDYRNNDQEARTKYFNNTLSKLPIHKKIQKLNLNDVMMDFGATSLYPSAMWDEN